MGTREVPYHDTMKVGLGYNLLTGEVLVSSAVTGSVSSIVGSSNNMDGDASTRWVKDHSAGSGLGRFGVDGLDR